MSEYLNKQDVLEWLETEIQATSSNRDNLAESIRTVVGDLIAKIQSGAFDADTSEVQRLRAALEWIVECGTDYQSINKARNALHFIKGGEKDE